MIINVLPVFDLRGHKSTKYIIKIKILTRILNLVCLKKLFREVDKYLSSP